MHTEFAVRRLHPRIIDTDWLVLREMRVAIDRFAKLVARAGAIAIDLGCGSQPYRGLFEARSTIYKGADLQGAELTIDQGRVQAADAYADLVLSFQVLEHVADVGAYLDEARRLLKEDGWFILSTHGSWLYHPHPEDHHRWTRQGLIAELASHGFETVESVSVLGPLAWTDSPAADAGLSRSAANPLCRCGFSRCARSLDEFAGLSGKSHHARMGHARQRLCLCHSRTSGGV